MRKITKEEIRQIAKKMYFEIDDQLVEELMANFQNVFDLIEELVTIDLKEVKPMEHCIENVPCILREDEVFVTSDEDYLKNANKIVNKYVVVK